MAKKAPTTNEARRVPATTDPTGAQEAAQARRVETGRAHRRALLESIAHRAIAALDAMDADPDAELCDDTEASAQRATLAPDWIPARRVRRRAQGFRHPSEATPLTPPRFPSKPTPNRPPREPRPGAMLRELFGVTGASLALHPDADLFAAAAGFALAWDAIEAGQRQGGDAYQAAIVGHARPACALADMLAGMPARTLDGVRAKAAAGLRQLSDSKPGERLARAALLDVLELVA